MRRFTVICALPFALLLTLTPRPAEGADPALFFDETFFILPEELEIAREESKGFVIMFEQEGCPFCWKMKRDTLSLDRVAGAFRKNFRIILMDIRGALPVTAFNGKEMTQKEFSIGQKVRLTPVFIFYSDEGAELLRLIGPYTPDDFLAAGRYVRERHYRTDKDFYLWLQKQDKGGA